MKVGYTGSRNGMNDAQREQLTKSLHTLSATELHHGDCVGGDAEAHMLGRTLGLRIVGHPPTAKGLRAFCECDLLQAPAPVVSRDHNSVMATGILVATPDGPEKLRSGTWTTIRFARRMRLPHIIITPDGTPTKYFHL